MGYTTAETKVAKDVLKYLDELIKGGAPLFYEHRSGSGGLNYKKGIPDFYIVINGMHVEVELKAADGHLSTMQEKFKYRCEKIWHIPYCCPHSLEEFKKFFEGFLCK